MITKVVVTIDHDEEITSLTVTDAVEYAVLDRLMDEAGDLLPHYNGIDVRHEGSVS